MTGRNASWELRGLTRGITHMVAIGAIGLAAPTAAAQSDVRIRVLDDVDAPVGYALVSVSGGASRVASGEGVIAYRGADGDSLQLRVRRIGHREHFGWVRRTNGEYRVRLERVTAMLSTVEVTAAPAPTNTPLVQRGFYDRVDRVQRGAILADFFTPEQLDERIGFTKISQMIAGSRYARVSSLQGNSSSTGPRVVVIVGRGGCPMTILLDGQKVRGTAQDVALAEVPQSIMGGNRGDPQAAKVSIDDVVDGRSVMAIEVYPSSGNAPPELVRGEGRGSCGIVALWTGGRR